MTKQRGFKIQIFVVAGIPNSMKIWTKSNWDGMGVVCPRGQYLSVKTRPEFDRSGVYILVGYDDETSLPVLYIGEASNLRARLDNHYANKDFWEQSVFFTRKGDGGRVDDGLVKGVASGDPLNKSEVKYLEARLFSIAKEHKRCRIDYGNVPKTPMLSEPDREVMEGYLEEMLSLMPVMGIHAFKSPSMIEGQGKKIYHCRGKRGDAEGYVTSNEGFAVKKGGVASRETAPASESFSFMRTREHLIKSDVLREDGDVYRFQQNFEFNSSSEAASVVLGRNANGRDQWKDKDGKTLKDNQAPA